MTVLLSPVPPHTGAYTRKRPASLRLPGDAQRPPAPRPRDPSPVQLTGQLVVIPPPRGGASPPVRGSASPPPLGGASPPATGGALKEPAAESVAEINLSDSPTALKTCMVSKCVFCRICLGASPAEVLHRDSEFIVIRDARPAAEHHYLVLPLTHAPDVKHMTAEDLPMLRRMEVLGLQVLQDQDAPMADLRMGFHMPPFQSISHLHLHCIAPASQMGYFNRNVAFRQDSFCFVSMDRLLARLLCE